MGLDSTEKKEVRGVCILFSTQSYKRSMTIANARVATPLLRAKEGVHVQRVNHGRYAPEECVKQRKEVS